MVFTIEPMINAGTTYDKLWPDNWTVVTEDGKRSAQFEHTILITETGCEILTVSPKYYDTSKPVTEMLPFDRAMFQRDLVVCCNKEEHRFLPNLCAFGSWSSSGSIDFFSHSCLSLLLRGMLLSTIQYGYNNYLASACTFGAVVAS